MMDDKVVAAAILECGGVPVASLILMDSYNCRECFKESDGPD